MLLSQIPRLVQLSSDLDKNRAAMGRMYTIKFHDDTIAAHDGVHRDMALNAARQTIMRELKRDRIQILQALKRLGVVFNEEEER
jgi:hypothetical protein